MSAASKKNKQQESSQIKESASDISARIAELSGDPGGSSAVDSGPVNPVADLPSTTSAAALAQELADEPSSSLASRLVDSKLTNIETKFLSAQEKGLAGIELRLRDFEREMDISLNAFKWSAVRWVLFPVGAMFIGILLAFLLPFLSMERRVTVLEVGAEQPHDVQVSDETSGEIGTPPPIADEPSNIP
ncbi:hypothetical protein KAR02_11070 [Candidatus Bipolaricaulota bacterium]|nr:hypothetical protein [Candidatus Bipolaricaulota bacterium]